MEERPWPMTKEQVQETAEELGYSLQFCCGVIRGGPREHSAIWLEKWPKARWWQWYFGVSAYGSLFQIGWLYDDGNP